METLRRVIADTQVTEATPGKPPRLLKTGWAHAAHANADAFERAV